MAGTPVGSRLKRPAQGLLKTFQLASLESKRARVVDHNAKETFRSGVIDKFSKYRDCGETVYSNWVSTIKHIKYQGTVYTIPYVSPPGL